MNRTEELQADRFIVTHTVTPNYAGERLDRFLKIYYRKRSREKIKNNIKDGYIKVVRPSVGPNDQYQTVGNLKPSSQLLDGDVVQVFSEKSAEPEVSFDYKILYQDPSICIVNKPANLPVHPAGKYFFHTLLIHLRTKGFTEALEADREFYLVHRIDKETSGILVMAREREVCAGIIDQFAQRKTKKTYMAVCHGRIEKELEIDFPLDLIPESAIKLKMGHIPVNAGGYEAKTVVKPLKTYRLKKENPFYQMRNRPELFQSADGQSDGQSDSQSDPNGTGIPNGEFTLVECFPKTGRQHQIRVHLDLVGHPLVGDKLYGVPIEIALKFFEKPQSRYKQENDSYVRYLSGVRTLTPEMNARLILPRHALHAAQIEFTHPVSNEMMKFSSPLPDDLKEFLDQECTEL